VLSLLKRIFLCGIYNYIKIILSQGDKKRKIERALSLKTALRLQIKEIEVLNYS